MQLSYILTDTDSILSKTLNLRDHDRTNGTGLYVSKQEVEERLKKENSKT